MAAAAALAGGENGRALTRLYHSKNSFCVLNGGPYADALDALNGPEVAPGNGNFSKVREPGCQCPTHCLSRCMHRRL